MKSLRLICLCLWWNNLLAQQQSTEIITTTPAETTIALQLEENFIESYVIGPFKVWHIAGFTICGVATIIIAVCCMVDLRVPRTAEEIEANYEQRQAAHSYIDKLARMEFTNLPLKSLAEQKKEREAKKKEKEQSVKGKGQVQQIRPQMPLAYNPRLMGMNGMMGMHPGMMGGMIGQHNVMNPGMMGLRMMGPSMMGAGTMSSHPQQSMMGAGMMSSNSQQSMMGNPAAMLMMANGKGWSSPQNQLSNSPGLSRHSSRSNLLNRAHPQNQSSKTLNIPDASQAEISRHSALLKLADGEDQKISQTVDVEINPIPTESTTAASEGKA